MFETVIDFSRRRAYGAERPKRRTQSIRVLQYNLPEPIRVFTAVMPKLSRRKEPLMPVVIETSMRCES